MSLQLTEADCTMIRFVGRMRLATAEQLARVLGRSPEATRRRARRLAQAGLLVLHRVEHRRAGVYTATAKGLAWAGVALRPRPLDLARLRHDLALASLALDLLGAHPGASWRSERELRAALAPGDRGHVPDGVLVLGDGAAVAVECELTPKGRRRLGRIVRFYARARNYREVWYFLAVPDALEGYRRLFAPYPHLRVQLWQPPEAARPPGGA